MSVWMRERRWSVAEGSDTDECPLCGIYRKHAGYTAETCGEGFQQLGCFINASGCPADLPEEK